MVKVCEDVFPKGIQGNKTAGFYMDGYLKSNLDLCKSVIKKDWDMILLVDGAEGVGKSVHAQQMAFYCDPSFNISRIVFRPDTFKEAVHKSEKYQAIVYDEAYGGLSSRASMSRVNKGLVSMLTEIRQKNLFIFIVLPSYFDLDKYAAIWRSRALVNVYHDKFQRGFFKFYSSEKKKYMYVLGKKTYSYNITKADFFGNFPDFYTVDKEAYKKKKDESLRFYQEQNEDESTPEKMRLKIYTKVAVHMKENGADVKFIAETLGCGVTTVYDHLRKAKKSPIIL